MSDTPNPISGRCFIAVGEDGLRAFSLDGREWTHRVNGKEGEVLSSAAFGNGRCVAAGRYGGDNHFYTTTDGVTWEAAKHDAKYTNFVRNMVFFRDQFMADGGGDNPFFLPSTDGVHWGEPRPITHGKEQHANSMLRRFAIGNDLLVGVGDFGRRSVTRDGIEWKNTPDAKPVDTLIDITFGNGIFVGGGMHGLRMRSADGLVWTDRVIGEEGEHINSMLWDGKQFVGVGQGATYVSPDGQKWERIPNTNAPTTAAFGAGIYTGAMWEGRLMRSTDGIHWEEVAHLTQNVQGLAFGKITP